MADPITWISIISAAVGAVGAIQQGQAQKQQAESQQQAALYNAEIDKQQAQQALQVSAGEQLALRRRQTQMAGKARAAVAQSGTGFGGSNADILEQSGTLAELDVLNLAYQGNLRSRGYLAQSDLDMMQASAAGNNARAAQTAGYLGAASSAAGGAYSIFKRPSGMDFGLDWPAQDRLTIYGASRGY